MDVSRLSVLLVVLLSLVAGVAVADGTATVAGHPSVDVFAPNNRLAPGSDATLNVYVQNDPVVNNPGPAAYESAVRTATGASVTVHAGDAPVTVLTGEQPVGTLPAGVNGPIPVGLRVAENATPGVYTLPVTVKYTQTTRVEYNATNGTTIRYVHKTVTHTRSLSVRVTDEARFRVSNVTTNVTAGETGTVAFDVTNVGSAPAQRATLTASSSTPGLLLDGSSASAAYVGSWPVGETHRVSFDASAARATGFRTSAITASVAYTDENGSARVSRPLSLGVPLPGQRRFNASVAASTLRVGDTGTLTVTVHNSGPTPVSDAVLRLTPENPLLSLRRTVIPLGTLGAGENANATVNATLPAGLDPGAYRVNAVVDYATDSGASRAQSDTLPLTATAAPHRDAFAVTPTDASVHVDSDGIAHVSVTNQLDHAVSDVAIQLDVTTPLSSKDPTAYVGRLAPGETANVSLGVSASADAIPGSEPARVTVAYTDTDGQHAEGGPYVVPVQVTQNPWRVLPDAALVLLVLAAAVAVWYRVSRS